MSTCGCGRTATVRVRVSLAHFYSDERARLTLNVPPSRSVRWLARRLRALCALPPALLLLADGHLLPPMERLHVLPPNTQLSVMPAPPHLLSETPALVAEFSPSEPSPAAPEPRHEQVALWESKQYALRELDRLCGKREHLANGDQGIAHEEALSPHTKREDATRRYCSSNVLLNPDYTPEESVHQEHTGDERMHQESVLEDSGEAGGGGGIQGTARARRRRVRRRKVAPYGGEACGAGGAPALRGGARGERAPRLVTALGNEPPPP